MADDRAQPAVLVAGAAERCREDIAQEGVLVAQALLASAETRPASDVVTSTVEEITGTAARTFHEWATDHADEFR